MEVLYTYHVMGVFLQPWPNWGNRILMPCQLHMLHILIAQNVESIRGDVLDGLCSKKATMARDKIFAMRAMFPNSLGALTVDYSLPDSDIYTDAARRILLATNSVEFLRYACQADRDDTFPTWVPSWTAPVNFPPDLVNHAPAMVAKHPIVSDSPKGILGLKGRRVDVATAAVSERFPSFGILSFTWIRSINVNHLCKASEILESWVEAAKTAKAIATEEPLIRQLLAFVCHMRNADPAYSKYARFLQVWYQRDFGIRPRVGLWEGLMIRNIQNARDFAYDFLELISDRSLFVTESGRIGLSTLVVREGDEIALFAGEKLPYLIRKSPSQPGRYTLVAPCWLSDAVNGEEWPGWSGKIEDLEDIELV